MNDEIASLRQREKFKSLLRDRGISLRRMSIDLNLNESYFQQFVTYGRPSFIEGDILRQAAAYLGESEEALSASSGAMRDSAPTTEYDPSSYRTPAGRKAGDGSLVVLPCYNLAHKLADTNWRDEKFQTQHLAVSRQMLRLITTTAPEHLILLKIHNDAMAPTLSKGDYAILDCSHAVAGEDGIYAILHESNLLIKRLTIDPIRKQVTLSRDNTAYPSIREYSLIDIPVAGRVIWVGKKL
jgi:phage repressor protein C with HTH and peptisase S24 domain